MSLRHTCMACGGSCHGVRIQLLGGDAHRVLQQAADLGISDPIDGETLRQVQGACVFQADDGMCRIHSAFGAAAKPTVCQQYPSVTVETESGVRDGVDPGCYTAVTSWITGPIASGPRGLARSSRLGPAEVRAEAHLLAVLDDDPRVAAIAAAVAGVPVARGLPPGLAGRIVTQLQDPALLRLIGRADAGPSAQAALRPVLEHAASLDAAAPPSWPVLSSEAERWAAEAMRRMLYLRLLDRVPVVAVAMLGVVGAVACGWHDPAAEPFGRAMAGWVRAIRAVPFLRRIITTPQALRWLATGR